MIKSKNLWPGLFIFAILSTLFLPGLLLAQSGNFETVRFAVIGDRTGSAVEGVYEKIIAEIRLLHPDFVISPGDCIEGYSNKPDEIRRQWKEYLRIVEPLRKNLFIAPGNHDIGNDQEEQIFRELVGEPYYSFNRGGIHFIMLDVSRWESGFQLPAQQINWLAEDLRASQNAIYTVVVFHKPIWYEALPQQRPDTLHALFSKYGVDAVFTGHYHKYFAGEYDGILYTNIGSSGAEYSPSASQLGYHYLWVTVDSLGIHIAPINMGAVFDWNETTLADKMAYDPIQVLGLTFAHPLVVGEDLKIPADTVDLLVNNSLTSCDLNDTLVWTVPENWKIEPGIMPVAVKAGENQSIRFQAECFGEIYPLPSVSTIFKFKEDRPAPVSRELWIAREAECVPVNEELKLDGHLTESFWQFPESLFVNHDGTAMTADPFRVYFAHDDSNLYIAAFCAEMRMDSMVALVDQHDGRIYGEDCLGFFLHAGSEPDTSYQIYFNPKGFAYDVRIARGPDGYMNSDRGWNGEYLAKSIMADAFWTFEAKIPVAQLNAKLEKGKDWNINFRRKQKRLGAASDWQLPLDSDPQTMGVLRIR